MKILMWLLASLFFVMFACSVVAFAVVTSFETFIAAILSLAFTMTAAALADR